MILALLLVPAAAGILILLVPSERPARVTLVAAALAHFGLTVTALAVRPGFALNGYLGADALGLLFLTITSALFLAAAIYGYGYLQREVRAPRADWVEGVLFSNYPQRIFVGCALLFLAAMSLVTLSQHMGLLWVGVEATTLASAPLIYFHRHHRSLEATWKYLLIGSVGIALALLGTFFLAVAASGSGGPVSLYLKDLIAGGGTLETTWLRAAFLLFLVGYGTKMGLAPFHTWLPDAHSESPSLVSALMSGALLNCAFLGLLRCYQVMNAAGESVFSQELFIGFGLFSMAVAAVFIIRQSDFKRMLAYSSVEHMGILALGVGIGGAATFGAMFHAVNHSLAKGLLFMAAGNTLALFRTTATRRVRGALRLLPVTGVLWVVGFLAVSGSPPFGSFLSEFTILQAGFSDGHWVAIVLYAVLLAVVFLAMGSIVFRMVQGEPWEGEVRPRREAILAILPPLVLALCALLLGIYTPPAFKDVLRDAAALAGGAP